MKPSQLFQSMKAHEYDLEQIKLSDEAPTTTTTKSVTFQATNSAPRSIEPVGKDLSQTEQLALLTKKFDHLNSKLGKYIKFCRKYKEAKEEITDQLIDLMTRIILTTEYLMRRKVVILIVTDNQGSHQKGLIKEEFASQERL